MLTDLPEEIRQYSNNLSGGYVKLFYGLDKSFRTVDVIILEQWQPEIEPMLLREKFEQAVRGRQDELRARLNKKAKMPMLVSSRPVDENGALIRWYEGAQLGDVFVGELYLLADGTRYIVFGAAIYPVGGMYGEDGEATEVVESRLKNLAVNTRAYINAESAGPGFCVNGVVLDDEHDDERGKFEFGSSSHKDVGFDTYTEAPAEQGEGSHARAAERMVGTPAGFWAGLHTLQKGTQRVAGMQAKESLRDLTEQKIKQQLFIVETWHDLPAYG